MFVLSHPVATRRAPSLAAVVDRLFDDSFDRVFGAESQTRTPAMDVVESDDAFTVTFDVPGASRETLAVSVEGRKVALTTVTPATKVEPAAVEGDVKPAAPRTLYRERPAARFARTVSLPAEVDQTTSQAKFENGVLTLVLAKRVKAGATQLQIG